MLDPVSSQAQVRRIQEHDTVLVIQNDSPLDADLFDVIRSGDDLQLQQPGQAALLVLAEDRFQDLRMTRRSLPLGHPSQAQPLRLFQPAQQRYYLVAAGLNCRIGGLLDRKVVSTVQEKVSFLLRRLVPRQPGQAVNPADPSTFNEYAWIPDGEEKGWRALQEGTLPPAGEERLPLFPLQFQFKGRKRRIWAGFIPVGSRETYQGGALGPLKVSSADLLGDPLADPRRAEFQTLVAAGMTALRQQIVDNPAGIGDLEAREVFLFALLDLAEFLQENLEGAWQAVLGNSWSGPANSQKPVFDRLAALTFKTGVHWDDALRQVWNQKQNMGRSSSAEC